jgi:hypothetical protein
MYTNTQFKLAMKKLFLWFLLLFPACSVNKTTVVADHVDADRAAQLTSYTQPFKVFSVGRWSNQYMILTLTDANNKYVVVKTPRDTALKIGSVYHINQ